MTCRDATKTRPHRRVFFRLVGGGSAPRGVPYAFPPPFPPAYPSAFARGFPSAFSYAFFLRFPVVFRFPFFWISPRSHSRRPLMSMRFAGSPQPRLANRRRNGYASPSCGAATTPLDPIWHAEIGTLGGASAAAQQSAVTQAAAEMGTPRAVFASQCRWASALESTYPARYLGIPVIPAETSTQAARRTYT